MIGNLNVIPAVVIDGGREWDLLIRAVERLWLQVLSFM